MVDDWEASQPGYVPTAQVLDHFHAEIDAVWAHLDEGPKERPKEHPIAAFDGAAKSTPDGTAGTIGTGALPPISNHAQTRTKPHNGVTIGLLAGADLLQTMSIPGLWAQSDLQHMVASYPMFILEREGTDVEQAIADIQTLDPNHDWRKNIHVMPQSIRNDVSSTKIRLFIRGNMSVKYLLPSCVDQYIQEHNLYRDDSGPKSCNRVTQS
jgi:nicotinate (nicotinamide) nucleotide adenylyltransferase